MALDGMFLSDLREEISKRSLEARVDKIFQPNKQEIVIGLRTRQMALKLLLSTRANSARISFVDEKIENPKTPYMFCMLLRKKLASARLIDLEQPGLERILILKFEATNELGDKEILKLIIEIMGKYSNLILVNKQNKIIESLKRVSSQVSSKREILPGLDYHLPPPQQKLNILDQPIAEIVSRIFANEPNMSLEKALLNSLQGVSPIICKYISWTACAKIGKSLDSKLEINQVNKEILQEVLSNLINKIKEKDLNPTMLTKDGIFYDFCFLKPDFVLDGIKTQEYKTYCELLEDFFGAKDSNERMQSKAQALNRALNNILNRAEKKTAIQVAELKEYGKKQNCKHLGDLLMANLYSIKPGARIIELEDFYNPNLPKIKIELDPDKTAIRNAQRFYKEYQKSKTAKKILVEQISQTAKQIEYIESTLDFLQRAKTQSEIDAIQKELIQQGYIKEKSCKKKQEKELPPIEFSCEQEGVKILVGRNNHQNDKLTFKIAKKTDIWLHIKDLPGSHVVILKEKNEELEPEILLKAAQLAAFNSKARQSAKVPIDYTFVKNVKKPAGAAPGKVIYENYKTLFVDPAEFG